MKKILDLSFTALLILGVASCGGGGGGGPEDDDGTGPSTNACAVLGLQTRIVNGTACSEQNSPVVAILLSAPGKSGLCSGTVIGPTAVLTAGHCFFEGFEARFVLVNGQRYSVTSSVVHPGLERRFDAVLNDVAIVRVNRTLSAPPVPLMVSRAVREGDIIQIFGYGEDEHQTSSHETAGVLRSGEMEVSGLTPLEILANFNGDGSNTCFGDSGGPALLHLAGQTGVVGVTSTGISETCGRGDVSRFADVQVSSILHFITQSVPEATVR